MEKQMRLGKTSGDPSPKFQSNFESFTKKFLSSPDIGVECPSCKTRIDFNGPVKWYGPDTFSCGSCDKFLSMKIVERALRDLCVQSFEITEY
ncbi:MAG: hypothetical protein ACXAAQ_06480 [Candidatus Thorarchaeota archaeon]|jgi:hypothetical protein